MSDPQPPLFPSSEAEPPPSPLPTLTAGSSLRAAVRAFGEHMRRIDFAENTIKSFLGDLSLLQRYLGHETQVGKIASADLRGFMEHLQHGRGVPCTPKSYSRRLTTLKVFFAWLASTNTVGHDPAAPLVHRPTASPLPLVLYEEQIERAQEASRAVLADARKPDPRPQLLFNLLLQTGMKKGECLALRPGHFDFSDPEAPVVYIRYQNPRQHHKERKLGLERSFPPLLRRYLAAYMPRDVLFPCTGRNLEYVLHRLAQAANLDGGLSFEMLRWTCAVREFRAGTDPEHLRRKLGLSRISWEDTLPKVEALAANSL